MVSPHDVYSRTNGGDPAVSCSLTVTSPVTHIFACDDMKHCKGNGYPAFRMDLEWISNEQRSAAPRSLFHRAPLGRGRTPALDGLRPRELNILSLPLHRARVFTGWELSSQFWRLGASRRSASGLSPGVVGESDQSWAPLRPSRVFAALWRAPVRPWGHLQFRYCGSPPAGADADAARGNADVDADADAHARGRCRALSCSAGANITVPTDACSRNRMQWPARRWHSIPGDSQ